MSPPTAACLLALLLAALVAHHGSSDSGGKRSLHNNNRDGDVSTVPYSTVDRLQVPDIFLIGAMKAGTTTLYELMANNSDVCSVGEKEKRFFIGSAFRKDWSQNLKAYTHAFKGCHSPQLTIDATPGYSAGKYSLVISRMKEHYTEATLAKKRFILILREPVSRLYSEYQMAVRLCLDLDKDLVRLSNAPTNFSSAEAKQKDRAYRAERHERACERVMSRTVLRRHQILSEQGAQMQGIAVENLLPFHDWCLTDVGLQEALRGNYQFIIKAFLSGFLRRSQLLLLSFDTLISNATVVTRALERFLPLTQKWGDAVSTPPPLPSRTADAGHAHTKLDCTTVMMLQKYYKTTNGCINCLLQHVQSGFGEPHPAEPPFPSFIDPFTKCSPRGLNQSELPPNTWKFTDLVRNAGEAEAEAAAQERRGDRQQGDDIEMGRDRVLDARALSNKKKKADKVRDHEREREEAGKKAVAAIKEAAAKAEDAPSADHYDFVFGWSTGHVGTTTLSEQRFYGSPDNVTFLHEMKFGKQGVPHAEYVYDTEKWLAGNYSTEYQYVKTRYVPWLLLNKYNRSRTLVDLGHNINYFYTALVDYLQHETHYSFAFARLRRERLETAQSLTFGHPGESFSDVCQDLVTRFCPFDHADEVVLRVPNGTWTWASFSNVQKALWIADETEARWRQLKARVPSLSYVEILWGKAWEGSMDHGALQVARLLGLHRVAKWDPAWPHMEAHVHAGEASTDPVALWQISIEDREYQEKMGFTYVPA